MSLEEFQKSFASVRSLPLDAQKLENTGTKSIISKYLLAALKALEIADLVITKQSDSIMSTNAALVKRCLQDDLNNGHAANCFPPAQYSSNVKKSNLTNKPLTFLFLKPKNTEIDFTSQENHKKVEIAMA